MQKSAHFRVDPKLAHVLGENYTSSEKALKELVDNAWDAEATEVHVTVPNILTDAPIIVQDNGSGMKTAELEAEYLNIASPRFSRKGDRTPNLNRTVKGRKGIGKFAGLILASEMELVTQAAGKRTRVLISKTVLMAALGDLEKVPLPLDVADSDPLDAKGTTITLRNLNPKLSPIQPDKLKELLALDYGREPSFVIFVNGERVFHHDIQGEKFQTEITLPNGQTATVSYTIADKPLPGKKSGLNVRVGGKSIGNVQSFLHDSHSEIPSRIQRRIVGEVSLPLLQEGEISSLGCDELPVRMAELMKRVDDVIWKQVTGPDARIKEIENHVLKAIQRSAMKSFEELCHGEQAQAGKATASLAIENLDQPRLRQVTENALSKAREVRSFAERLFQEESLWETFQPLSKAPHSDIQAVAEMLNEVGLAEMKTVHRQVSSRLRFLDTLDELATNPKTSETQMHTALSNALWVFGPEYSLMASNRQLRSIIEDYIGSQYTGEDAANRPDLFLAGNVFKRHLLIEFKKPTLKVGRSAEAQAKGYADTLTSRLGVSFDILIIGGEVEPKLVHEYDGQRTKLLSYRAVIEMAKTQLEWMLKELSSNPK